MNFFRAVATHVPSCKQLGKKGEPRTQRGDIGRTRPKKKKKLDKNRTFFAPSQLKFHEQLERLLLFDPAKQTPGIRAHLLRETFGFGSTRSRVVFLATISITEEDASGVRHRIATNTRALEAESDTGLLEGQWAHRQSVNPTSNRNPSPTPLPFPTSVSLSRARARPPRPGETKKDGEAK
ncbi:hypothetical protein B296_00035737 [Ensete ventricosum]|uniref:Uncharacterized protein n=1 Tax=Ensete ventricosum TaxID=4639 RepID=A0A426YXA1_ENSVE|nr:hypothetical protein B296_00035737 [Ensete ventricosum]